MEFPKKGDIIIADAGPHAGHEMGGHNPKEENIRRHYVVMSTSAYNEATHMFIGMPITTAIVIFMLLVNQNFCRRRILWYHDELGHDIPQYSGQ